MDFNEKKLKEASITDLVRELNNRDEIIATKIWTVDDIKETLCYHTKYKELIKEFPDLKDTADKLVDKILDENYGYLLERLSDCNDAEWELIDFAISETLDNLTENDIKNLGA